MMSVPTQILGALQNSFRGPGHLAVPGYECSVARFHSPNPLVTRLVDAMPSSWGRYLEGNYPVEAQIRFTQLYLQHQVRACPVCADSISVLQTLMFCSKGELPWKVRREFGNQVRAVVESSWKDYMTLVESFTTDSMGRIHA